MSGAEKVRLIRNPETEEDTAQAVVRTRLVAPLAKVLSAGATRAATYDCRVGTSISTSDSRSRNSASAQPVDGAKGTAIRNRLEGRWVKTMVRTRPIRRGRGAPPPGESGLGHMKAREDTD